MDLERYPVTTDSTRATYEFLSEGPKGTIKKVIHYQDLGQNRFNLAFGDWNEEKREIDDKIRSNNSDMDKVLRTVALTVIEFLQHTPEAVVFLRGSTEARTRLYQMGIIENEPEIAKLFDIQGFFGNSWESFKRGKNYQAFAIKAK
jgi:hypothetical protein